MELNRLLTRFPLILTEAAVVEAVAHSAPEHLHPELFNALMVDDKAGRQVLTRLYTAFRDVARDHDLPFILTTPTWRANRERVFRAGAPEDINERAVAFVKHFISDTEDAARISLGGILGCRNDCYRPDQGLETGEARDFHAWQAGRLAEGGAEFLMAATLPALPEAFGIAMAMAETGLPYIISFVINREGEVLDGTPLDRAVDRMDQALPRPPAGYMVNCAHPSFLRADHQPRQLFSRLIGFQANGSDLDHDQLDRAPEQKAADIREWAGQMIRLNRDFGIKILGGCCGTRAGHLDAIARGLQQQDRI